MWGMWLIVPALMGVAYWVLGVERYRWRYGYYHVHQACDWLRDSDPSVRWGALDKVSNVCPQPSLFTEARQAHAEVCSVLVLVATNITQIGKYLHALYELYIQ